MSRLDKLNHGLSRKAWELLLLKLTTTPLTGLNIYLACVVVHNTENSGWFICKTQEEILECLDSVPL